MDTFIFLSYGHNDYDNLVRKIKRDLETNDTFKVFLDTDYLNDGDWEIKITKAVHNCDYFVFFVSKRSISLDGYCLNELSRACELKKKIIPVLLDDSYVPLSITRLQRLILSSALDKKGNIIDIVYNSVYGKLMKVLTGQEELGFYNRDYDFTNSMQAFDSVEISNHIDGFEGREYIFKDFEDWLHNKDSLPIYILEAVPGVGKSAIASMISARYPENAAAIHFCNFNNSEKNNIKNVIKNVACQLSYRNNDYLEAMSNILSKNGSLNELDSRRVFEVLILEPASRIHFDEPQVLIIDALDEALVNGKNEIAELIISNASRLPKWLRFFLTTRPRRDVMVYFNSCHIFRIEEFGEQNNEDLRLFYKNNLDDLSKDNLEILISKSHGSFLYANTIVRNIKSGDLSLDNVNSFPDGIYSYYALWFDRIFFSDHAFLDYEKAKKVLSLLQVSSVAPDMDFILEATELEEGELTRILEGLSSFIEINDNLIKTRHKSIVDWLSNIDECPSRYFISKKSSYTFLLNYIKKKRETGRAWRRDIHVIQDYSIALRYLKKYDDLFDLLIDSDYQNVCLKSSFYTLYEALYEYISNLKVLYDVDKSYLDDIYESECFIGIFSEYRMNIYNSGLFIQLKECGFEDYLKANSDKNFGIEFELGELHFYYISLSFIEASKQIKKIASLYPLEKMDISQRSELKRMMMLVYRKLVMFKELEEIATSTIEDARAAKNQFEESLAYLTLSKVYCRELRREDCYKASNRAIEILLEKVKEQEDESKKIADHLFLAEDYRVAADGAIWLKDYEKAKEYLDEASAIYIRYNQFDRYYPRFLYTSLFYEIVTSNRDEKITKLITNIKELLDKSKDEYDKGQLAFLQALFYLKSADGNIDKLNEAKASIQKAIKNDEKLSIQLEKLEAEELANIISRALGEEESYSNHYNEYTDKWSKYVKEYLLEVIR